MKLPIPIHSTRNRPRRKHFAERHPWVSVAGLLLLSWAIVVMVTYGIQQILK